MDVGQAMQQAIVDRAVGYIAIIWIVVAITIGLWASEIKKRRFWTWFALSFLTGPVAWYLLLFRLDVAIPADMRMSCPKCGRAMRKDQKRCPRCKAWVDTESKDRATELGRQAATMVFTARRLFGGARRIADEAAKRRESAQRPPPSAPGKR